MKIDAIKVYRVELPFKHPYHLSGGRLIESYDSTIAEVICDNGLTGWGETCPFGNQYLAAYGEGARSGLAELAPKLIGADPTGLDKLNHMMDWFLPGHDYVKAAIDLACWDILGKAAGLPVCTLLGGRHEGPTRYAGSVPTDVPDAVSRTIEAYRDRGYRCFSCKMGSDPVSNIELIRSILADAKGQDRYIIDANGGMRPAHALHMINAVLDAVAGIDLMFEQLCPTYEECFAVRARVSVPMMLDETLDDYGVVLRAVCERAMDGANIKIGRVGGLTKARRMRDACLAAGILVSIQETGGSEITNAAVAHMGQTIPTQLRHSCWNTVELVVEQVAAADYVDTGEGVIAGEAPGLGVEPLGEVLGAPVATYR